MMGLSQNRAQGTVDIIEFMSLNVKPREMAETTMAMSKNSRDFESREARVMEV